MAQRVPRPATLEDLERLPPTVKGEIIEGVLYTQARPRPRHQNIATVMADDVCGPYQRGRGGPGDWWILVEPGIELPGSPEFSPDLAGWRRSVLSELPDDEPIRVVPTWVCEILSRSTRGYDTLTKKPYYAKIGVEWAWYVDPEARTLTVSKLHEGRWLEVAVHGEDELVRAEPFAAVEVRVGDWWGGGQRDD
jgi:Uma2 family endonuclease